jgi:hypothetical protein
MVVMITRYYDKLTYEKIGSPTKQSKMYVKKNGRKVWGTVLSVNTLPNCPFKTDIEIVLAPFIKVVSSTNINTLPQSKE